MGRRVIHQLHPVWKAKKLLIRSFTFLTTQPHDSREFNEDECHHLDELISVEALLSEDRNRCHWMTYTPRSCANLRSSKREVRSVFPSVNLKRVILVCLVWITNQTSETHSHFRRSTLRQSDRIDLLFIILFSGLLIHYAEKESTKKCKLRRKRHLKVCLF